MTKEISARQQFEKQIAALVEKFRQRELEYKFGGYTELQARIDFIDPFFEALGWDVRNTQRVSERERDVVVESGATRGRPDYNFRWNGQTQFFVEAKAPHVALTDPVVLQAKKYAFNETSQTVILAAATDFEEFRLYEVRDISYLRQASKGLVFAYRYDEYLTPKALDDLWKLSRESVAAGSLNALIAPTARRARQRVPLDQQFLSDLVGWREKLAKAVFKAHPDLSADDLNNVVQIFLDRLIFIRVAEDRGVLPEGQLIEIARHWSQSEQSKPIVAELIPLFRLVNQMLNGEIFKPHKCEEIKWDSALVAEIVDEGLEPYNFAQIGVELLGSIYERYLGKTIRVTETRAIVDDKPEVRKAGGVYYTPKYIVDYIVAQTVGKLIEGKTPKQIEKLRVLDPACGSGSFLLGAYQALLDYHTRYFAERANRRGGGGGNGGQTALLREPRAEYGEFKLSLEHKAQILRNNIFGVDIDPQAVEITMMSLYIKMLEGERGAITGQGVLPRLCDNIKCGNSLIGYDIGDLSDEERARVNPFDWNSKSEGFGEIMAAGGFDAVMGNPPWGAEYHSAEKDYLRRKFDDIHVRTPESFNYFLAQMWNCTNKRGQVGLIVPSSFLKQHEFWKTRQMLVDATCIHRVCDLGDRVFEHVTAPACIVIFGASKENCQSLYLDLRQTDRANLGTNLWQERGGVAASQIGRDSESFALQIHRGTTVIEKCYRWRTLKDVAEDVATGISTGLDAAFVRTLAEIKRLKLERDLLRKLVIGGEIHRYALTPESGKYVMYTTRGVDINDYPNCHAALLDYRDRLKKRVETASGLIPWYALYRPRRQKLFDQPKILIRQTADRILAVYDSAQWYCLKSAIIVQLKDEQSVTYPYLLGLLNSRLLHFLYDDLVGEQSRVFPEVKPVQLFKLPIRTINFADPADKARHDKMTALVQRMLTLHQQKQAAKSDTARARVEREINVTDEQIDALVYELYGLTKEEIKIVQEAK